MKYEHTVRWVSRMTIDELGADGWKVVAATTDRIYFQRPVLQSQWLRFRYRAGVVLVTVALTYAAVVFGLILWRLEQ